jgi:hypoxanthine phosphoribosyltransferase
MDKITFSWQDYNKMVAELGRQISVDNFRPDYIVGLTRGGLTAAVMLSHYFNVPMHALGVSLRDQTGLGCESNLWMAEDAFGYVSTEERETGQEHLPYSLAKAKKILIVDDINDTGSTINWIIDDWESGCLPIDERWDHVWGDNVRFATVVDNLASNANIKMSYSAYEINKADKDVWVEFPYETWWRT